MTGSFGLAAARSGAGPGVCLPRLGQQALAQQGVEQLHSGPPGQVVIAGPSLGERDRPP